MKTLRKDAKSAARRSPFKASSVAAKKRARLQTSAKSFYAVPAVAGRGILSPAKARRIVNKVLAGKTFEADA